MKLLKKNQVVIYVIALMLMAVAYLNYTTNTTEQSVEASMQMEARDDSKIANNTNNIISTDNANNTVNTDNTASIGDARLVSSDDVVSNDDDYFSKSKLERDTMYSQMIESYENILNSTNSLEIQKQSATDEIKKINDTKNSIMICENLIQTKGFENSMIFVNGDSISIILKSDELTQEEVAQVQNIISREMHAEIENIHISTK